jgi:nitroreductase
MVSRAWAGDNYLMGFLEAEAAKNPEKDQYLEILFGTLRSCSIKWNRALFSVYNLARYYSLNYRREFMPDILETIFKRRSIRKYQEKPVERVKLLTLLKAAMAAPTASNNQPWEFVAVDDVAVLEQFRSRMKYGHYNAPAAIVVCHNPQIGKAQRSNRFWVQDCSAAIQNILIAALGLGLGTVWLGVYPNEETVAIVKEAVGLPENIIPLAVIYVGYPDEEKEARTQYEETRVHWQHY